MYYTRTRTNTHLHSWTLVVFAHRRTHTPSANQPELIRRSKWRKSLTLDSFAKYCASLSQHDSHFPNTQLRRICCSASSPNLKQYYKINVHGNKDAFQSVWKHFFFFAFACAVETDWTQFSVIKQSVWWFTPGRKRKEVKGVCSPTSLTQKVKSDWSSGWNNHFLLVADEV